MIGEVSFSLPLASAVNTTTSPESTKLFDQGKKKKEVCKGWC